MDTNDIFEHIPEVHEVECLLVSQIGHRVDDPPIVQVRVSTGESVVSNSLHSAIDEITRSHLSGVSQLWKRFVSGDLELRL